jgi:hypothetical protein
MPHLVPLRREVRRPGVDIIRDARRPLGDRHSAGSTAATFPGLFDISRTDVSPKYRRMRDTGNFHVPGEQGDKIRGCNGSAPPAKQKSS